MLSAATVGLILVLAPGAAAAEGKTLWLIEPLYPGQEFMVSRTEEVLAKMLVTTLKDQLIGQRALASHLAGKKADLACLTGDATCTDPVDSFVASLGLERVVLLKGGQDESGYHFRMTGYVPAKGEVASGDGAGKDLEKALLAAMIKLVPLASTLEITSDPPGATVFVDGEKVGVTPYSGQILPGERTIKLDAVSHMPVEKKIEVVIRGAVKVSEKLEKVPARLVVAASPAGTSITVDGKKAGTDKLDTATKPGRHRILLEKEGYEPLDEEIDIAPGATFTYEKKLAQTGWTSFKATLAEAQAEIYSRKQYMTLTFEGMQWWGNALYALRDPSAKFTDTVWGRQLLSDSRSLSGIGFDYGTTGKYFGLDVVGASGYFLADTWRYTLYGTDLGTQGAAKPVFIVLRLAQPQLRLAIWRFLLSVQGGFEVRFLYLSPSEPVGSKELFALDVSVSVQAALRFYIVDGFFVEGGWRQGFTPFVSRSPLAGFRAGVGYAF